MRTIRTILCVFGLAVACTTANAQYAVVVESNLVYATGAVNAHAGGGSTNLVLDLYRPAVTSTATRSALVLVHGGSFQTGSRRSPDMVDAAMFFAQRGWVCCSIEYRLADDDPPAPPWVEIFGDPAINAANAAAVDTKRAIRWLRAHAADYGRDPNRVAGLGHSSGAYCVLMAAITDEEDFANDEGTADPDQWAAFSGKLNACAEVSGDDGPFDFEFDEGDPPLLIWHGSDDQVVAYQEAVNLHHECLDHGIPHRFFTLEGKDHGAETWTALSGGKNVKQHAFEFMELFFDLWIDIDVQAGTNVLSWPSVSNAAYEVGCTPDLTRPFTNIVASNLMSAGNTATLSLPTGQGSQFYRTRVLSGQNRD